MTPVAMCNNCVTSRGFCGTMTKYIAEGDSDNGASRYRRKKDCDYTSSYSHGIMQITVIEKRCTSLSQTLILLVIRT